MSPLTVSNYFFKEWLWPVGYLFRAQLLFENVEKDFHLRHTWAEHFLRFRRAIHESPWQGLPELTNAHGAECYYSCPSQAWSSATALDALYDIYQHTVSGQQITSGKQK